MNAKYPDIKIEIVVDYAFTDIVAQRFDVGIRFGDQVAKDMIAERIAAINGMGLAYVAEQRARTYIDEGCLAQVLEDWCPTFPGFHMYYASRRQSSRVMRLLVDALRYQR